LNSSRTEKRTTPSAGSSDRKVYTIAGKKYYQQELVLGQIQQLIRFLDSIEVPEDFGEEVPLVRFLRILGDHIGEFLAIILTPEGVRPKDKDMDAVREDMEEVTQGQLMEILEDFFSFTRPSDLLAWFGDLVGRMFPSEGKTIGNGLSSILRGGTSQEGNQSSGRSRSR